MPYLRTVWNLSTCILRQGLDHQYNIVQQCIRSCSWRAFKQTPILCPLDTFFYEIWNESKIFCTNRDKSCFGQLSFVHIEDQKWKKANRVLFVQVQNCQCLLGEILEKASSYKYLCEEIVEMWVCGHNS